MYFIGIDTAQINCGFSILDEKNNVVLTTNFGREMLKSEQGKAVPDFRKNAEMRRLWDGYFQKLKEPVGMVLCEGPDYGSSNITQISIGSIHGVLWDYLMQHNYNFAIATPRSINYAIFGTAKDITKMMTINEMKRRYPGTKLRDSNMADSLAMAYVAKKFFELLDGGTELSPGEREVLASPKKLKGQPKGLIYKLGVKYMILNQEVFKWRAENSKPPQVLLSQMQQKDFPVVTASST